MRVMEARSNLRLEINQVYYLPVDGYLTLNGQRFVHLPVFRPEKGYHAIDHFFSALAAQYMNNAFAVILSGMGADGTAGIRWIRAEGGITFAQDESAAYKGMPQYATESGFIDFILSPENIAAELAALKNYAFRNGAILAHLENSRMQLSRIYLLMSDKYGVDFSLYKESTINRRIIRRMTINRIPNVETYVKHLEVYPSEIELLYRDLLTGVGGFFREPALERVLIKKIFPLLMKERKPESPLRIWMPACAGGEEAASMAIFLLEYMWSKEVHVPVQIFATDLNPAAIDMARTGFYTKAAVQHVSPPRLRKFFTKVEGGYQISKVVRDMCTFATHNLLKDPPYARMDMVSCRHALFTLEQTAQDKAMRIFHNCLKPGGFLVLDRSAELHESLPLFQRAFKEWNIYTRNVGVLIPVKEDEDAPILVVVREESIQEALSPTDTGSSAPTWEQERIKELEERLADNGRQMLTMLNEFDRTRMELQVAREELLSSNVELQGINKDLEAFKEDLQAKNEELLTLNEEITRRNDELKEAIDYNESIIETIRQPLLDLYSDLRIRSGNKAFYNLFPFKRDDIEGNYLNEVAEGLFNTKILIYGLQQAITKRLPFEDIELNLPIPGAGERIILFTATRINGQPGRRARILLVMEDVTERRQSW